MDPLSIVASSLAILGATGKALKGLESAWELRHRDWEFASILDKIRDLKVILKALEFSLKDLQKPGTGSESLRYFASIISEHFEQTKDIFDELSKLAQEVGPLYGGTDVLDKPSKRSWIRHKQKLLYLLDRAYSRAMALATSQTLLSGVHSTSVTRQVSTTILALGGSSTKTQTLIQSQSPSGTQAQVLLQRCTIDLDTPHDSPEITSPRSPDILPITSRRSSIDTFRTALSANPGHGSIDPVLSHTDDRDLAVEPFHTATANPLDSRPKLLSILREPDAESCRLFCKCQCHLTSQFRSPKWLQNFVGSVAFYGHGSILLNRRPCNRKLCRRGGSTHIQVHYRAPTWVMSTFNVCVRTESVRGFGLYVRRILDFDTPAYKAVRNGQVDVVKNMVAKRELSPYDMCNYGFSMLDLAIPFPELYECLVAEGANPLIRNDHGIMGCYWGLQLALTPPKERDSHHGRSVHPNLHWCKNTFLTTEILEQQDFSTLHQIVLGLNNTRINLKDTIQCGDVDVNITDTHGLTPLHWASRRGDVHSVRILCENGADVDQLNCEGRTPLHYAVQWMHENCLETLLRGGASPNVRDRYGTTAIMAAFFPFYTSYIKEVLLKIVIMLMEAGADPNSRINSINGTILHVAAKRGERKVASTLLRHGAEVNTTDSSGRTPLHNCTRGNQCELATLLLENGADVTALDVRGSTSLHLCAENGSNSTATVLLDYGADINARDFEDYTPVLRAIEHDRIDTVELLVNAGALCHVGEDISTTIPYVALVQGTFRTMRLVTGYLEAGKIPQINFGEEWRGFKGVQKLKTERSGPNIISPDWEEDWEEGWEEHNAFLRLAKAWGVINQEEFDVLLAKRGFREIEDTRSEQIEEEEAQSEQSEEETFEDALEA